jgi:hypothetical protein
MEMAKQAEPRREIEIFSTYEWLDTEGSKCPFNHFSLIKSTQVPDELLATLPEAKMEEVKKGFSVSSVWESLV